MSKTQLKLAGATVLAVALMAGGLSIATPGLYKPEQTSGVVVIPETFVRRWDPVTIFFPSATGPKSGPEDKPGRFVRISPQHPGAYSWLNEKTLQFSPAEPWPALTRIKVRAKGKRFDLTTLMSPPTRSIPSDGARGLSSIETISLTFPEPVPVTSLERMIKIELRPLPGLDPEAARWLSSEHFEVKAMERRSPSAAARYVLLLRSPIKESTKAIVHFQLSLNERRKESFTQLSFSTVEAFAVTRMGCPQGMLPVTPQGSVYRAEQAVRCDGQRTFELEFSSAPRELSPVQARNLVRFSPSVEKLQYKLQGRRLSVWGAFKNEVRYRVSVHPTLVTDKRDRPLTLSGRSELHLFYPKRSTFLRLTRADGVIERFGPRMIPLQGRGFDRVDLRIYPIDPLNLSFWPFPGRPVSVDESKRRPGPGEEPSPQKGLGGNLSERTLRAQLHNLGSPPLSRVVDLPVSKGSSGRFGLDLGPHLDFLSGRRAPGSYLVGIRKLDGSKNRSWMRVQLTDLSLTAIEEPHRIRFFVTSLKTGAPVPGASIKVQTTKRGAIYDAFTGTTDRAGAAVWTPPGDVPYVSSSVRRVLVKKGKDTLVVNPRASASRFRGGRWRSDRRWLDWALSSRIEKRGDQAKELCHIFTERPIYRPGEKVYIKGYVRERHEGALRNVHGTYKLVVSGPGSLAWDWKVELSEAAAFHQVFQEEELPSGTFNATLLSPKGVRRCSVGFKVESYRVPTFEVQIHGPDQVPLDRPFELKLGASYYAGGPVAGSAVRWRVTQFPYTWSPPSARKGFFYSTDSRFGRSGRFSASPSSAEDAQTDTSGAATLSLNPALESSAQPRSYVVEATVTGADDQTVSSTKRTVALPPFVLGLKVPRYLERARVIEPEILVLNPKGRPIEKTVTVRLIHRTWHSHLQASDFSDGVAKYVTDVVEKRLSERTVQVEKRITKTSLAISEPGVYVVEIEARDRLGRVQVVSVDLYAGGDQPVSWAQPEGKTFKVSTDKKRYRPGEVAKFVLQSPFATGQALVIVEGPDRNTYEWLPVKGGAAVYSHRVKKNEVPRVPVHFVLMRGRVEGASADLGRPKTIASTRWINVEPVEHRLVVKLEHPKQAQPGDKLKMRINLKHRGKPSAGEVTLWLVDQAVLALAPEQPLDPLSAFITDARSYLKVFDSRNQVLGRIITAENPGGDGYDEGEASAKRGRERSLLDKTSVRKNFKTVPYFNPSIQVPGSGTIVVEVPLPDNLTNFKIRAKAVAAEDRFGFAKSSVAVRLPVLVQPNLPRFVRALDQLKGGAIARVVEGPPGAGRVELKTAGVQALGAAQRKIQLTKPQALRVDFDMKVGASSFSRVRAEHPKATIQVAVERTEDRARDAFSVELPIRPDRQETQLQVIRTVSAKKPLKIEGLKEPARPGSVERRVLVSNQPALIKMTAGLDYLLSYNHANTESMISQARVYLAMEQLRAQLHIPAAGATMRKAVEDTLTWLEQVVSSSGHVAYWPGSQSYVWLSAFTLEFLVDAKKAGYKVDSGIFDRVARGLERSLRSDYSGFVDGASYFERTAALRALAYADRFNSAYAAELGRRSNYLNLESTARVVSAFVMAGETGSGVVQKLDKRLLDGMIVRLHQGKKIYGGLQRSGGARPTTILPSETRTIAHMARAMFKVNADRERPRLLFDALLTLGKDDGWGSTQANAAALLALKALLTSDTGLPQQTVSISVGGKRQRFKLSGDAPVAFMKTSQTGPIEVSLSSGPNVVARVESRYMAAADGSKSPSWSKGFVVTRRLQKIREGQPPEKLPIDEAGVSVPLKIGDVVEEHIELINPKARHFVALVVPLAAGMEPLNPTLQTAPAEAKPSRSDSASATYRFFGDDEIRYNFERLPKGTYHFYFRTRATSEGRFIQPSARAQMMYNESVSGGAPGAKIVIER